MNVNCPTAPPSVAGSVVVSMLTVEVSLSASSTVSLFAVPTARLCPLVSAVPESSV